MNRRQALQSIGALALGASPLLASNNSGRIKVAMGKDFDFYLSANAYEICIDNGMQYVSYEEFEHKFQELGSKATENQFAKRGIFFTRSAQILFLFSAKSNEFRTHPILIRLIEEKTKHFEHLHVLEIPFATTEGWHINKVYGCEEITENHRCWKNDGSIRFKSKV